MRRRIAAVVAVSLAISIDACGGTAPARADSATSTAVNTKADEDSIQAIMGRLNIAMSAGDTAAIVGFYAEDGADFTPGMAPAMGRDAVRKEYGEIFTAMKGLKASFQNSDVTVAKSGELAVSRHSYEFSYTDAKGKPTTERGTVLVSWKKIGGQWHIATSMNAPAPGS